MEHITKVPTIVGPDVVLARAVPSAYYVRRCTPLIDTNTIHTSPGYVFSIQALAFIGRLRVNIFYAKIFVLILFLR
jgi:hypothetical protein